MTWEIRETTSSPQHICPFIQEHRAKTRPVERSASDAAMVVVPRSTAIPYNSGFSVSGTGPASMISVASPDDRKPPEPASGTYAAVPAGEGAARTGSMSSPSCAPFHKLPPRTNALHPSENPPATEETSSHIQIERADSTGTLPACPARQSPLAQSGSPPGFPPWRPDKAPGNRPDGNFFAVPAVSDIFLVPGQRIYGAFTDQILHRPSFDMNPHLAFPQVPCPPQTARISSPFCRIVSSTVSRCRTLMRRPDGWNKILTAIALPPFFCCMTSRRNRKRVQEFRPCETSVPFPLRTRYNRLFFFVQ